MLREQRSPRISSSNCSSMSVDVLMVLLDRGIACSDTGFCVISPGSNSIHNTAKYSFLFCFVSACKASECHRWALEDRLHTGFTIVQGKPKERHPSSCFLLFGLEGSWFGSRYGDASSSALSFCGSSITNLWIMLAVSKHSCFYHTMTPYCNDCMSPLGESLHHLMTSDVCTPRNFVVDHFLCFDQIEP